MNAPRPETTGRWVAITKGKTRVVGWIEVFSALGGKVWVTIPGVSRIVEVGS